MASRVPKIGENQKRANAVSLLRKAKQSLSENNCAAAYKYFVNYFDSMKDPSQVPPFLQTIFTKLVCKLGIVLEETNNIEELLKCYIQAINLFPNNYTILNNLGSYMFKAGEVDIAKRYLELAVKANKDYLPAEKNLMHVKWHQIPRWHFRMLNDKQRNLSYNEAISSIIRKGYKDVIDIGAGCGLLSFLASQNPGATVMAIEENKTLFDIFKNGLKEHFVENVEVFNCHSTDFSEPVGKCNLLVTEIFDVALFGERALETIIHALTVLRTEEDYKIIPCGAKVYATGINSDELIRKHQYVHKSFLDQLNLDKICIKQIESEPYDAEYLSESNVTYMTDTQQIFDIQFSNEAQISQILKDKDYHQTLNLRCKGGVIHALAVWFDLYLTEEISITTNPFSEKCVKCWEQAVFYLDHPVHVKEDEIFSFKVTVLDCKLNFTMVGSDKISHQCFRVSKEIITCLNDDQWVEAVILLAQKCNYPNFPVVDFNIFPMLGILLAKKNYYVSHIIKNDCDRIFFEYILSLNNITTDKFTLFNEGVSLETCTRQQPVIFFFDVINTDGSIEDNSYLRNTELPHSINIPKVVKVNVQLIYSSYIDQCNRVNDDNVLSFKIGKFINDYTGYEHPNLDDKFRYIEHSEMVTFTLEEDGEKSLQIIVNRSGVVNALYYWYHIQFYKDVIFSTLNSCHFKKSCFLLDSTKEVEVGNTFNVAMHTDGSYIKFCLR